MAINLKMIETETQRKMPVLINIDGKDFYKLHKCVIHQNFCFDLANELISNL